jgi:hypothetical protein
MLCLGGHWGDKNIGREREGTRELRLRQSVHQHNRLAQFLQPELTLLTLFQMFIDMALLFD